MSNFNKITIGTAQFGMPYGLNGASKVTKAEIEKILSHSHDSGINSIDTAPIYGSSEKILGNIGVKNWNITTKLSSVPENCNSVYDWVQNEVKTSLKNLNVDHIDTLLLHRPEQLETSLGCEIFEALEKLRSSGYVKKHGFSAYNVNEIQKYLRRYDFNVIQAPINVIDKNLIASGVAAKLKQEGKIVQARSIFLQGLLLSKHHQKTRKFNKWKPVWKQLNTWLEMQNISALNACLNFVFNQSDVDNIVVGILDSRQLDEILGCVSKNKIVVPDFEVADLETLIDPRKWHLL